MSDEPAPTTAREGADRTWPLIAWRWLRGLNWIHLVGLVLIFVGAIYWSKGVTAANQARELLNNGTQMTVSSSDVLVAENFRRGGSTMDTIKARVLIPEIGGRVELRRINPPSGSPVRASFSPGWTTATAQTGYAAPFRVRYLQQGAEIVAMADSDIEIAIQQEDRILGWVMVVGAALFALAFIPRLLRKARHKSTP